MANVAIVKASDLARAGRMDAGFWVAMERLRKAGDEPDVLRRQIGAEEAAAALRTLPSSPLIVKALAPMFAGSSPARPAQRDAIERAIAIDPHMALGLVLSSLDALRAEAEATLTEAKERHARITGLSTLRRRPK